MATQEEIAKLKALARGIQDDPIFTKFKNRAAEPQPYDDDDDEPEPDFDDDEDFDAEGQIQYKPDTSEPVTLTISVSQKVQVTQYETAEAHLSMTITADTTEAEMDAALQNGKLGWKKLTTSIVEKIGELEAGAALGRNAPKRSNR